jgi:hypothetical protein
MDIILVWIPSHKGIAGNEHVDLLARKACIEGIEPPNFVRPYWDYYNILKRKAWDEWSMDWKENNTSKGARLRSIQPNIPRIPWFKSIRLNKQDVSVISRLRIGHCLTAQHLHRIGILPDPRCECGEEIQTIDHLLLACPLTGCGNIFNQGDLPAPLSSVSLLSMRPRDSYKYIVEFVRKYNLKISNFK